MSENNGTNCHSNHTSQVDSEEPSNSHLPKYTINKKPKKKILKISKIIGLSVVLFFTASIIWLRQVSREIEEQSPTVVYDPLPISEIHVVPNWTEDIFHNMKYGDIDDLIAKVGRPAWILYSTNSVTYAHWDGLFQNPIPANSWGSVQVGFNEESREILSKEFNGSTRGEEYEILYKLEDYFLKVEAFQTNWTQEIFENIEVATTYISIFTEDEKFSHGDNFEELVQKVGEPIEIWEPPITDDEVRIFTASWRYGDVYIEIQFDEKTNMITNKYILYGVE